MKIRNKISTLLIAFGIYVICSSSIVWANTYEFYDITTGETVTKEIGISDDLSPTESHGGAGVYLQPRKVIGENSMYAVHDDISYLKPFGCVCYVESYWTSSDGTKSHATGTGTMIGKNTVLTAGHVIYDYKKGPADEIYISPGKYLNKLPYGRNKIVDCTYPKELKKLNYDDTSTYSYETYDIAVLHTNNSIGSKCGYDSVEYISDAKMSSVPSNQLIINGYPKAGVPLAEFDEKTNSAYTVKGVMYSAIGYTVECSGRKITYDTDTESGFSGGGLRVYSEKTNKDVIVGVNTFSPKSPSRQYNGGVHIDANYLTWIKSLIK